MKTCVHIRQYLAEFFLEWENMSDKSGRENPNTRFVSYGFIPEYNVVCHLWVNLKRYGTAKLATNDVIWRMLFAWITKATNTHPEYVMLITFRRKYCLRERTSILRYIQHRDASCHQFFFLARQGAEGNPHHYDRNISLFPSWSG